MILNLTTFSSEPIYSQIANQILDRIIDNELSPGEELISIGKLSHQQHIGKSTIHKAYRKLEKLGVIRTIQPERFFVNQLSEKEISQLINQRKFTGLSEFEKEKISAELEAARQIQKDMIPKELPDSDQISVSAYSTLSVDVCGDFYDFYKIDDNTYGFLIGDASGKGLPAAMLISQIYAIIKSDISYKRSIKQTLSLLNTYLKKYSAAKNFATLFYGIYNLKSNKLQFANAGHNYPLIVKNDGKIETLKTTGPALGILNNIDYEIGETRIEEGNFLFLFTDGLPEAMNNEGIQFGEGRILHYCAKNYKKHTKEFINGIKNKLFSFKSKQNEIDDITFMVVKRNKAK